MAADGQAAGGVAAGGVAAGGVAAGGVAAGGVGMRDAGAGKCRVREILDRVGDKWSLFVIFRLGAGPQRFTELKRSVDGISQRMLTVTLRGLERDGIVTRTVYPVVPPRVDYELTKMGQALLDAIGSLMAWADAHLDQVDAARAAYDARSRLPPSPVQPPPSLIHR
jgi:DNA-binding HxlR family transcriptional regulator